MTSSHCSVLQAQIFVRRLLHTGRSVFYPGPCVNICLKWSVTAGGEVQSSVNVFKHLGFRSVPCFGSTHWMWEDKAAWPFGLMAQVQHKVTGFQTCWCFPPKRKWHVDWPWSLLTMHREKRLLFIAHLVILLFLGLLRKRTFLSLHRVHKRWECTLQCVVALGI